MDDNEQQLRRLCEVAKPPIEWSSLKDVTTLNLQDCGLSSLPSNLGEAMPNLSILFCPKNKFEELPAVIGSCSKLQVGSKGGSKLCFEDFSTGWSDGFVQEQRYETNPSRCAATAAEVVDSDGQPNRRNA